MHLKHGRLNKEIRARRNRPVSLDEFPNSNLSILIANLQVLLIDVDYGNEVERRSIDSCSELQSFLNIGVVWLHCQGWCIISTKPYIINTCMRAFKLFIGFGYTQS